MDEAVIESLKPEGRWLLSQGSPGLRARTKEWLLGLPRDHPSVAEERRQYRRDPALARLLAGQAPDGSWGGRYLYVPKHHSTFHVLAVLAEMGLDRGFPEVERAAEFALTFQASNGEVYECRKAGGGKPSRERPVPCVTGRLMASLAQLGYAEDPRVRRGIEYLLSTQRPDGGWSCEGRAMPRGSESEQPCLGMTAGFLALAESVPGLPGLKAAKRARDLVGSFYFKDPKGYHVANTWAKLNHPASMLDLAAVGRTLLTLGHKSPALKRGADYLMTRRNPDGTWPLDGHPYRPPVGPGRRGQPHPWVTLRVLRFLKAAGGWTPG